jgi:hypothetical protein
MRAYVLLVFLCGFVAMATLFGATRYMDPFYYYGSADRPDINAIRYGVVDYPEAAKVYSVEWYRPHSLIMGSSRAQIGLDPGHKGFVRPPVYSLAYPGSSMHRTLALFEHAVATNQIKQVVLAVDFFMFRASTGSDDEFARLAALPDGSAPSPLKHWRARAIDFWRSSFSSTAIKLAASDLFANSQAFDLRYMRWVMRRDGHNELFSPQNLDYEAIFGAVEGAFAKDYATGEFCLSSKPGYSSLGDLRRLIARARDLAIDLKIVVSPAHATLAEVIDRSGLWPTWETWKREIVRLATEYASPNWSTSVFDFSGYNLVTTEPVPIGAPLSQMRNYWDPSHYKQQVGDLMLDVVLGEHSEASKAKFGKRISLETIEQHLESIRRDQTLWRASHPEQASRVKGFEAAKKVEDTNAPRWCGHLSHP